MKKYHPMTMIALIILLLSGALGSSAAGSARAEEVKLNIEPAWATYGEVQGVRLGVAVAGAGDVNGDGLADIVIGAERGGLDREGQVKLYLGVAGPGGPLDTAAWSVLGEKKGGLFGTAVDGGGDVNHDGWDDIVVGAPNYTGEVTAEAGEGAVYVYFGGTDGPGLTADWKLEGDLPGVKMGAAVGLGYINGDDYADVIVGMPGYVNGTLENAGAAFVYFGTEDGPDTSYGWLDIGEQLSAQFGLEVAYAGDVNGDGYGDVLIGEPYYNYDIYQDAGAVHLYLGNQFSLSNVPAWSYTGYRGDDRLGTAVATAGDLNGDGCDEIVIGAPGYNAEGMLDTGRAYVFYGCQNESASTLNTIPDWEYSYPQAGANTGIDVSSGGDTNHDGYDELLVGVHMFDDEQANEGAVMAFFGRPGVISTQAGWQVEGNKNDTWFGFAIDAAGDTNGDGLSDVVVGSPEYRHDEIIKGAAFLYFGSAGQSIYQTLIPFMWK